MESNGVTSAIGDCSALHPAVQAALDAHPAAPAERAKKALATLMREHNPATRPEAWSSSTLTGGGFPFEIAFATVDQDLRYTAEAAGPETPPGRRLAAAFDRLRRLGIAVPAQVIAVMRRLQAAGSMTYGAWVGGRHGPVGDDYKLYVEIPGDAACRSGSLEPFGVTPPKLPDRSATLRMVGYACAAGRCEAYYRIRSATAHHLPRLLAPCGLEGRAEELADVLADAYGQPLRDKLPGASIGASYATTSGGRASVFTMFFYGRVFWGSDARIRRRFRHRAERLGWDTTAYQSVTAPIASRESWTTHHGLLGFSVAEAMPIALSIGVRPVGPDR
jgi:hypothetical protein